MTEEAVADHQRPPPSPRTDLATAAVLLVFALAVIRMAVAMPTFTDRGGDPFTAPGIVPGFYGIVLAGLAIVLAVRSVLRGALGPGGGAERAAPGAAATSPIRLAAAVFLSLAFSLGLIGSLPFWAAAALFVTAFVAIFEWNDTDSPGRRRRRLATAALLGIATGVAVTLVFEKLFLVRLP
ncbi:MAG: tripartite tricarboxylate transporter TctB family protein [Alphaproteobacteria bacterium]